MSRPVLTLTAFGVLFLTACEKKADPNARTEDLSGDAYTSLDTMNNDGTIAMPSSTSGSSNTYGSNYGSTPTNSTLYAPPASVYTPPPAAETSYTASPAYTSATSTDAPRAPTSSDELLAPSSGGGSTYVVKRGDSLSKIARMHYGTDKRWRDIYKANKARIADPNKIRPGTKLIIP